MSYVEHCTKHGQYKSDYCGGCVEDNAARVVDLEIKQGRFKERISQLESQRDTALHNYERARLQRDQLIKQNNLNAERVIEFEAQLATVTELNEKHHSFWKECEKIIDDFAGRVEYLQTQLETECMTKDELQARLYEDHERCVSLELENMKLREVLEELVDIVQGHLEDGDKLDSFTLQPAKQALSATQELKHFAVTPFVAVCGADEPNQYTTTIRAGVTCPACAVSNEGEVK